MSRALLEKTLSGKIINNTKAALQTRYWRKNN